MQSQKQTISFTAYQKFVILVLALTQFTIILDFMVMSPLGDILMKSLSIKPSQFGIAVSSYAFSAGISGLLTAGLQINLTARNYSYSFTLVLLSALFFAV